MEMLKVFGENGQQFAIDVGGASFRVQGRVLEVFYCIKHNTEKTIGGCQNEKVFSLTCLSAERAITETLL